MLKNLFKAADARLDNNKNCKIMNLINLINEEDEEQELVQKAL